MRIKIEINMDGLKHEDLRGQINEVLAMLVEAVKRDVADPSLKIEDHMSIDFELPNEALTEVSHTANKV